MLMLFVANLGIFRIRQELHKSNCLKINNKSKSFIQRVAQVISCQLFQEICMKSKNIVLCLSFHGD